jgi:UDPglucose 6-dehydrogenase
MHVSIVGIGYVGLVVSGCLSAWGHRVAGVETNRDRLTALRRGELPFHEPGLEELVRDGVADGRLTFGSDPAAVADADVVIVAVGTHDGNGGWQTASLIGALDRIVPLIRDDAVLAIRSTVPPSLINDLGHIVAGIRAAAGRPALAVVLNPEFTREGSAVGDFLRPDRVVIGIVDDPGSHGVATLRGLYASVDAPIVVTTAVNAAMIKLASNLFLATKISFANELAVACDAFGASVDEVLGGMALDPRIGGSFMRPGVGFGGSCLPHQLRMTVLDAAAIDLEMPILAAADQTNRRQPMRFVERLADGLGGLSGRRIGILGLTFKPGTDDLREAPSLDIASRLLEGGAEVVAYDPMERARAGAQLKVLGLRTTDRVVDVFDDADAIGLVTEWPEFTSLDWRGLSNRMRGRLVVDGRNALHADDIVDAGLSYVGFGRPVRNPVRVGEVVELRTRRDQVAAEQDIAAVV